MALLNRPVCEWKDIPSSWTLVAYICPFYYTVALEWPKTHMPGNQGSQTCPYFESEPNAKSSGSASSGAHVQLHPDATSTLTLNKWPVTSPHYL